MHGYTVTVSLYHSVVSLLSSCKVLLVYHIIYVDYVCTCMQLSIYSGMSACVCVYVTWHQTHTVKVTQLHIWYTWRAAQQASLDQYQVFKCTESATQGMACMRIYLHMGSQLQCIRVLHSLKHSFKKVNGLTCLAPCRTIHSR